MYAEQIKEIVWIAALSMDPKPATYGVRVSSTAVGVPDTFTNYQLQRVTYRPLRTDELDMLEVSAGDRTAAYTIYRRDLEISGKLATPSVPILPLPQLTYTITIADDTNTINTWTIESVSNDDLQSEYTCLCRIAHSNTSPQSAVRG